MSITRLVHRGKIFPVRASSGAMLFSPADLETLRIHFEKAISQTKTTPSNAR
jgi:hypothetical protein